MGVFFETLLNDVGILEYSAKRGALDKKGVNKNYDNVTDDEAVDRVEELYRKAYAEIQKFIQ